MKYREPQRINQIKALRIEHLREGDSLFPKHLAVHGESEIWLVTILVRRGLLPETSGIMDFYSKVEAERFLEEYSDWRTPDNAFRAPDVETPEEIQDIIRNSIDSGSSLGFFGEIDDDFPEVWETLKEAGLNDGYNLSPDVLSFLGQSRVDTMKSIHGDNWKAAAEMEYCWLNMAPSAPAYIAAAVNFHYYISGNELTAGYLYRDLQTLVLGVEALARNSIARAEKAGAGGGTSSSSNRKKRLSAVLVAIEKLNENNPIFSAMSSREIYRFTRNFCIEADPELWSQGKGQISQYLKDIETSPVGSEMQARFRAVFGTRRLSG